MSNIVWAKYVALLVETASGDPIYSEKDIVTMQKLLGDRYEYTILHQAEATSTNIRAKLNELAKKLTPNDTFVFYYSGHGDRFANGDSNETDKRDDFLVTSDLKYITDTKITNVLLDNELNYLYAQIKARKVIIIDACHSATMDKGVMVDRVKQFKSKKGFVIRGFEVNPKWEKAKNENFLHFAGAKENESALASKYNDGGVFTLALAKVIKEYGNISFDRLEKLVQSNIKDFTPNISPNSTIDKRKLYTKDIFVVPHTQKTLKSLLDSKPQTIKVMTQKRATSYTIGKFIRIKGYLDKKPNSNIYLLELRGENSYKLISYKIKCIDLKDGENQMCQFPELKATKPTGVSTLYIIKSSKPLHFNNSKGSIISDENFDAPISLLEQLESMDFEVGKLEIEIR